MRYVCVFVLLMLLSSACRDKIICAAFQSTYILDDSTRTAYFSYVWQLDEETRQQYISSLDANTDTTSLSEDSLAVAVGGNEVQRGWGEYYAYAGEYQPKQHNVRKSKYGVMKYEPYWLKNYNMKLSPMENVLGPEKEKPATAPSDELDSALIAGTQVELDSSAVVLGDSSAVAIDSTAVASAEVTEEEKPKKKEQRYRFRYDPKDNFNVEQDYYNKYFGVLLLDLTPEPEPTPADSTAIGGEQSVPDSLNNEGKKPFGALKGLFKKKNKEDSASDDPVDNEEEDTGSEEEEGGN